jgi:NSS family neurotransmitter:Na+ symporter
MAARDAADVRESERWRSQFGFVLATAGSAVGLGNIWRFPSAAAENGGGAFVVLFLLVIVVVGVPGLMAELSLGRHTRCNALDAFLAVRPRTWWVVAGALGLLASFVVLSYYAVIAGWVLAYAFKAASGALQGMDGPALRDAYAAFVRHPWEPVAWQAIFLALTAAVVLGGVRRGIERWSLLLMPGLWDSWRFSPRACSCSRARGTASSGSSVRTGRTSVAVPCCARWARCSLASGSAWGS